MLLELRQLVAGYGNKQVLVDVSMHVTSGEIVAVIGPNGAGKSTVLKAVCGLLSTWDGSVWFDGIRIDGCSPARNVSRGITYCPQGNRVFGELTVMDNLHIGGVSLRSLEVKSQIDYVISVFPQLKALLNRCAANLSGGEQQMLAVARALMSRPKLLMLDEPSLGLAPGLVDDLFGTLQEIRTQGVAILIVEQKVRKVLDISDRVYALRLGAVAHSDESTTLRGEHDKLRQIFL